MTADVFRELRHGKEKLREFEEVFGTGPHRQGATEIVYKTLADLLGKLAKTGIEHNRGYYTDTQGVQLEFFSRSMDYRRANDLAELYDFIVTPANWGERNRILAKPTYPTI